MRLPLLFTAAAPLVLLAACATAPGGTTTALAAASPAAAAEPVASASSYGKFLAGEQALNNGRSAEAAKFFDQARVESGDPMIAERAFTAALLAGEVQKASTLAPTGEAASEAAKRLGKLVMGVE
ncbi:MAG TPA: hypothetical protein VFE10_09600, partial [Phenylobacterium sp.]|nr:hypothetical protein [Phenylobacterium sp.]